jgi:hypothetical protein
MTLTFSLLMQVVGWRSSSQQCLKGSMIDVQGSPGMMAEMQRCDPRRRHSLSGSSRVGNRAADPGAERRRSGMTGGESIRMSSAAVNPCLWLQWFWSVFLCGVTPEGVRGPARFRYEKRSRSKATSSVGPWPYPRIAAMLPLARHGTRHTAPRRDARPPNFVAIAATKYPRAGSARKLIVGLSRS